MDNETKPTSGTKFIREFIHALVDMFHHASSRERSVVILEKITQRALSLQDYCAIWIFRKDAETGNIFLYSHHQLDPAMVEIQDKLAFTNCVAKFVFETGQPIALRDLDHCLRLPPEILSRNLEMQSHLSVPITINDNTVGVLNVGARNKRKFLIHEIQFLAVVAGIIGLLFKMEDRHRAMDDQTFFFKDTNLHNLIDIIMDGVLVLERDFRFTMINPSRKTFLEGFSEFEKGEFFHKLTDLHQNVIRELDAGKEIFEQEIVLSSPAGRCLRIIAAPLKKTDGIVESVLLAVKDLTREKVTARKEKIQTRISSIGTFVEGLTHELNNPLSAVSGYLQMLKKKSADHEDLLHITEKMETELNRAIVLVKDLVAMVQKKPVEKIPVHLDVLIQGLMDELRPQAEKHSIELTLETAEDLPVLYLERENIRQVFSVIMENAVLKIVQAGLQGSVNVSIQELEDAVQIVFVDSSPGVFLDRPREDFQLPSEEETVDRDMEIKFAVCHSVIRDHGGVMYAEILAGQGVALIVEIPTFFEDI